MAQYELRSVRGNEGRLVHVRVNPAEFGHEHPNERNSNSGRDRSIPGSPPSRPISPPEVIIQRRRLPSMEEPQQTECNGGRILVKLLVFVFMLILVAVVKSSIKSSSSSSSRSSDYSYSDYIPPVQTKPYEPPVPEALQPIEEYPRVVDEGREQLKEKVCTTRVCVNLASTIRSSMNLSVNPCDDFYQYSCGGWIRNASLPPGRTIWTPMHERNRRNQMIIRDAFSRKKNNVTKAEQKASQFYFSCLDEDGKREKLGSEPLQNVFQNIDGWSSFLVYQNDNQDNNTLSNNVITTHEMNISRWSFQKTLQDLTNLYDVHTGFVKWTVQAHPRQRTENVLMIQHDSLGSGDEMIQKLTNTENNFERIDVVFFMASVAELMGVGNIFTAMEIMEEVLDFELEITRVTKKFKKEGGPSMFHVLTLAEFEILVDMINWTTFLNNAFFKIHKRITRRTEILVQDPQLFVQLSHIVKDKLRTIEGKVVLRNYLMWKLLLKMSPYLSQEFQDTWRLLGVSGKPEAWEVCVKSTEKVFGLPLGSMFKKEMEFPNVAQKMSQETMTNIRKAFQDNLPYISWLKDTTTKAIVHKRVGSMKSILGYPDILLKNSGLVDKMYDNLVIKEDDYFGNVVKAIQFKLRRNWGQGQFSSVSQREQNDELWMSPGKATAYYLGLTNKVTVTAGLLQKPFFDPGYPQSVNYGGMGMIMGHEVLHAFDDADSINENSQKLFDYNSLNQFKRNTQCFKSQYSDFVIGNKTIELEKTLGENVADNGGLKTAYRAYTKYNLINGDFYLPDLNFTHNQLFFVASAQLWCMAGTEEDIASQLSWDVHAPGELRAKNPLKNLPQFAEAFDCPWETPMNPYEKCSVW